MTYIASFVQFAFIILVAPFAAGLVRFFKARLQGRRGASPFLPYVTLLTLMKKENVISSAASWVFRVAPFMVLASAFGLVLTVPTLYRGTISAGMGDFLVIAGILMAGSIFLVLGGIDPGSAFGGMGSSREMTMAALLEPTLIMIFATYSFITGAFTVDGMLGSSLLASNPFLWLTILALIMLSLGENARYPVDNPATHLELTMIHEAMILEYSGPYLAMMEYASSIKLTVFAFLIGNFVFPASVISAGSGLAGIALGVAIAIAKTVIIMAALALIESTIVKMRFFRMNEYVTISFFAAFFGMAAALLTKVMGLTVSYHASFSVLTVFFVVFLFGTYRVHSILRYYILSSLSIAGVAVSLGLLDRTDLVHLLIFAAGTVLVKAILVPTIILYALKRYKVVNQFKAFLRPAASYFLAALIMIVTFFAVNDTPLIGAVRWASVLYASIALVLFGITKMVIRRNIFSQIIGLLVLENGLALLTLVTIKTLPLLIELSILAVTAMSVVILVKLSASIKELYGSTDTEELRNLTD